MLAKATNRTLILVDELGKGTEATAGACLCASMLEELDKKASLGIFATCGPSPLHCQDASACLLPLKLCLRTSLSTG